MSTGRRLDVHGKDFIVKAMQFTYTHTKYAGYLGYVTQAIVNNLAPLLFVTFQNQFGLDLKDIGFFISLNFTIQMLVDLAAPQILAKTGYRAAAVFAHAAAAAGLIGMGVLPFLTPVPFAGLLAAVILNAVGGGLIEVLISPIIEALPTGGKKSAMSLLHSFYCWGHVGVVLLATLFFVTVGIDRWPILTALFACIPLGNALLFSKVPLRTLEEEGHHADFKKLIASRAFWSFMVVMVCAGASEQAMSQWSSLFAESGLNVSKTLGDLFGPCFFAALMGISRSLYGIWGERINLKAAMAASSILCIVSYSLAVFSKNPVFGFIGMGLCGFSVGILWPGAFSLSSGIKGGTMMFAYLALGGDIGCALGPGLVGAAGAKAQALFPELASSLSGEAGLKIGLCTAMIFPILLCLMLLLITCRRKTQKKGDFQHDQSDSF